MTAMLVSDHGPTPRRRGSILAAGAQAGECYRHHENITDIDLHALEILSAFALLSAAISHRAALPASAAPATYHYRCGRRVSCLLRRASTPGPRP
jgi:hypothetical protein